MKTTQQHINYWKHRELDWKKQYFDTHGHPHRELILKAMAKFRFGSVFEVGCASGPNLLRIHFGFPGVQIGGCDVSAGAIASAKENIPGAHLDVSPAHDIFMSDKSVDLTLSDACMIYIDRYWRGIEIKWLELPSWLQDRLPHFLGVIPYPSIKPSPITKTLREIKRMTRNNIVFCEFHSDSLYQRTRLQMQSGYYAYNWRKLLEKNGYHDVELHKIPAEVWPGTPWQEFGYIITASL